MARLEVRGGRGGGMLSAETSNCEGGACTRGNDAWYLSASSNSSTFLYKSARTCCWWLMCEGWTTSPLSLCLCSSASLLFFISTRFRTSCSCRITSWRAFIMRSRASRCCRNSSRFSRPPVAILTAFSALEANAYVSFRLGDKNNNV